MGCNQFILGTNTTNVAHIKCSGTFVDMKPDGEPWLIYVYIHTTLVKPS